jgi:predicted DNA-binding transcriptional regulator AlpA
MNESLAPQNDHSSIKILRLPQVCEVTGFCRSMIYQMEAKLRFPKRVKIGTRPGARNEAEYDPCQRARLNWVSAVGRYPAIIPGNWRSHLFTPYLLAYGHPWLAGYLPRKGRWMFPVAHNSGG